MQFWYVKNGEKAGPVEDYEMRSLVRAGEVSAETRVWHEGCDNWLKAEEVELLSGEFVLLAEKEAEANEPPPVPLSWPEFQPWRRLGARWFDANLYFLLFVSGHLLVMGGIPEMFSAENPWILILHALPMILMEGALVSQWGTTPGKWLLDMRVRRFDQSLLPVGSSLMRAFRVWILGMGMGLGILMIIGHIAAFVMGKKRGAPLWDLATGYQVPGAPVTKARVALFIALYLLVNSLLAWILWPTLSELSATMEKAAASEG
ncbi:MAG: RDD family protein [Verrucomicrobiales bacterium]